MHQQRQGAVVLLELGLEYTHKWRAQDTVDAFVQVTKGLASIVEGFVMQRSLCIDKRPQRGSGPAG